MPAINDASIAPPIIQPTPPSNPGHKKPKNTGLDANVIVSRAAHYLGLPHDSGMCDRYSEDSILGHHNVYDDATQYYNWAKTRGSLHTDAPPAGVPVFYAGNATTKHGHVAISAGGGYVYSTDAYGNKVGKVRYDKVWGGKGSGQFLGWTQDVNTKRGGAATHINYDPSTVGKAPKVDVPRNITSNAHPTPNPKPGIDPSSTKASTEEDSAPPINLAAAGSVGTVDLQSINNPNMSKQFSGTVQGNVPLVG